MKHLPVLITEVLDSLHLEKRGLIIDATLGLGGHTERILQDHRFKGTLLGIDQDPQHLEFATKRLKSYGDRFSARRCNFSELESLVSQEEIVFDGILFDLGIASPHLDQAERGFSFQHNGPLDMRMDPDQKLTAAKLINTAKQHELIQIFRDYGEEKLSPQLAKRICEQREVAPLQTTQELSTLVSEVYKRSHFRYSEKHPATRVFQALRIAVNRELLVLEKALSSAIRLIQPGGRIVVISYHSLEDRIVKQLFREASNPCTCPPKFPVCTCGLQSQLRILTKKPIVPSENEIAMNPRSRSAKMRVAEKR